MWYVDAWAVLDGIAFASAREPEDLHARSTVFMSVPDLEPVPVGRISTALRATRAGFQEGFRDPEGREIGFDTLEQIRELIRRGYRGGGLGPGAAGPPPPPTPPEGEEPSPVLPDGPSEDGGRYYDSRIEALPHNRAWVDYSDLSVAGPREALMEKLVRTGGDAGLYPYLRAFGEATLVEFVYRNRTTLYGTYPMGLLLRWAALLYTLGLWEGPGEFAEFLADSGIDPATRDVLRESMYVLPYAWATWAENVYPVAIEALLFELPCPLRRVWNPKIQRLSDKLLLPLTDRKYFQYNPELPEFIPLLLCAMAIVSDRPLVHWRVPLAMNADKRRLIARAFLWISREMPGVELPWQAESLLGQYSLDRLNWRVSVPPPPGHRAN